MVNTAIAETAFKLEYSEPGPPSHQPRLFIMEVLYGKCLTLYLYFTGKNINAL